MHPFTLSADDQLEDLLAFHRRAEKHLAHLAHLAAELELRGPGPATCAAAQSLLERLGHASATHHAVEEAQLLPAIEHRIADPGALAEFREMRRLLVYEHLAIAEAWRPLRRPLEAVAEGMLRSLDHDAIAAFRALYMRHIVGEEGTLHRFTLRYLPPVMPMAGRRERATA